MSTTVSYKGNTIATVENNTKTLKTAGKYMEGDVVLTDVTSGGAANYVEGTFTASETTGITQTINIPYNGNGYPIAWVIEPTGGFYGNSEMSSLIQRYAIVNYAGTKSDTDTPPVYSTSGVTDLTSGATISFVYKNSTSNSYIIGYSGLVAIVYTGGEEAYSVQAREVTWKDATTMNIFVASTSYGFASGIEYTYHIIYSE